MQSFIRVIKALSDTSRIKIIKKLEKKELCVCELPAALGLAQPTVSKHLKLLEGVELVESRKERSWGNYSLVRENGSPYAAAMLILMKDWLNSEKEIAERIMQLPTFNFQLGD